MKVKFICKQGTDSLQVGQAVETEAVAERIKLLALVICQRLSAFDPAEFSYSAQSWQTFLPAKNAIVEAVMKAFGLWLAVFIRVNLFKTGIGIKL